MGKKEDEINESADCPVENVISKCKNCGTELSGTYCHNCGQHRNTEKLTIKSIFPNFMYGVTSIDRGIMYTIKMLYTNPGKMIREYIDGKRVIYAKPFSMMVILAGIYGILFSFAIILKNNGLNLDLSVEPPKGDYTLLQNIAYTILIWTKKSIIFSSLLMIPVYALSSKIVFNKLGLKKFTYAEILFIFAFIACQQLIIDIILLPLPIFLPTDSGLMNYIDTAKYLSYFMLAAWSFKGLLSIKWKKAITKSIGMYLMALLLLIAAIMVIAAILRLILMMTGNAEFKINL